MTSLSPSASFIRQVFGPGTVNPVYLSSLANADAKDREPGEKHVSTRELAIVDLFVGKWNRRDRGLFFCVSTLRPDARPERAGGSPRNKTNVSEICLLHADVDLKSIEGEGDDAERIAAIVAKVSSLPLPPSLIVLSGNGLHLYWLLNEGVEANEEVVPRVEAALRLLADLVAGDLAVAHPAALMRLPGTHNTKDRAWKSVEVLSARWGARYELAEIEEMLSFVSPVIRRKEREGASAPSAAVNPFLAVAARLGFRPPIDVEQRLAAMTYQGAGETSIHSTQLSVTASLLTRGVDLEEVVDTVLVATRAAAGELGSRWNWAREERAIRRMCEDWQRKNPKPREVARNHRPDETVHGEAEAASAASSASASSVLATGTGTVVHLEERRAKKAHKGEKTPVHVVVGAAVIEALRARGDDLLFMPKAAWRYSGGLWTMEVDGLRSWLDVEIETACRALNIESANRLVGEARNWIQRNPDLWRENVPWDAHGKISTRSGLVDPKTLALTPATAQHFCTWHVDCDYDPAARCPWWETMIADTFGDRRPEVREQLVGTVQEALGAALIDTKPRPLSKALIFQGGSNFGKSGLLDVLGGIFGAEPIATSLEALEGAHGLMAFTRRAPWVLHEAFDQRKWHFSSSVKAIITGDPVPINIKNGPMLNVRVKAPIFWGTNHPPQFKEATKAIVNRLIVIECRREFVEGHPVGAAAEALRHGFDKPSSLVLASERSGVLNWAIVGLQRALERGTIQVNDEIRDAADEIRRDSNLVAGFIEECTSFDRDMRVSVPDFCAAFAVWWLENRGEDRRIPSNEAISKAVVALGDPRIAVHSKELRDNSRRYYAGIILSERGLELWRRAIEAKTFEGKTASTTPIDGRVNDEIPPAWLTRPSIAAMRVTGWRDSYGRGASRTVTGEETVTAGTVTSGSVTGPSPGQPSQGQAPVNLKKPVF